MYFQLVLPKQLKIKDSVGQGVRRRLVKATNVLLYYNQPLFLSVLDKNITKKICL
jgi:hypothetical protein